MKQLAKAFLPLVLMVGWLLQGAAADSLKPQDQERVRTLIAGLGSASFADREQAAKDLLASGPLALASLRAAVQNPDAEISVRAARLVAALEEQVLTEKMLAAKKVRLNVKDVSVIEAVDELARLSGYQLDVLGTDRAILSERKITLDTGEVTYWQAVQQLRQQGRLSERILQLANNNTFYYSRKNGIQQPYVQQQPVRTSIMLSVDGEIKEQPVCHMGSVRIQALSAEKVVPGEAQVMIEVNAESRLQDFGVVGLPMVSKIVDDRGQALTMIEPGSGADITTHTARFAGNNGNLNGNGIMIVNGNVVPTNATYGTGPVPQRTVAVRVKLGDKEAKSLKELSGKLSVQALGAPEELVRVKGVLGSAGMTFAGKDGNVIHMKSVEKQEDGSYRVSLALENPTIQDPFAGRNIRFRGNFNNNLNGVPYNVQTNMPKMVDADGRECVAEVVSQGANTLSGGQLVLTTVLDYRPTGEPAQLVLHGQRIVLFSVPFTLKNVPIQ